MGGRDGTIRGNEPAERPEYTLEPAPRRHGVHTALPGRVTSWRSGSCRDSESLGAHPEREFFRARRSALVNLKNVKEIRPFFESGFLPVTNDEPRSEIAVKKRQSKQVCRLIPGL